MVRPGMLFPTLPLLPDETPASYAGRLALLHDCATTRQFCLEMGCRFHDLIRGRADALERLADITGYEPASTAIILDERNYLYRGESLTYESIQRGRFRFCAACLADDIALSPQTTPLAAYGRSIWCLSSLETCAIHCCALSEIEVPDRFAQHDAIAHIQRILPNLEQCNQQAEKRQLTGFELYQLNRLDKRPQTATWLDGLEFHAAVKICQMLGTAALLGTRCVQRDAGQADQRRIHDAGYEIVKNGAPTIRAFLEGLREAASRTAGKSAGPKNHFGPIYQWLQYRAVAPGFEPIRAVVRQYIMDTYALAEGDIVFDVPMRKRVLHTVQSAAIETGSHPKRLRTILAANGVIPATHKTLQSRAMTFDAVAVAPLLEKIKNQIKTAEVASYLNTSRGILRELMAAGIIRPFHDSDGTGIAFTRAEIERFLSKLQEGAQEVESYEPPLMDIPTAYNQHHCSTATIVQLILGRKLRWVGKKKSGKGISSVLIDMNEIRDQVRPPRKAAVTASGLAKELRIRSDTARELIDRGILPAKIEKRRWNGADTRIVDNKDIEAFRAKYVSLYELAQDQGMYRAELGKILDEQGVKPALDRKIYRTKFYLRDEVMRCLDGNSLNVAF